jgi:hypothetical protein
MTGHDYLLKWIKETYPLMDLADYGELDYYDMQKFAIWLVKLLTKPDFKCSHEKTLTDPDKCYEPDCPNCIF